MYVSKNLEKKKLIKKIRKKLAKIILENLTKLLNHKFSLKKEKENHIRPFRPFPLVL